MVRLFLCALVCLAGEAAAQPSMPPDMSHGNESGARSSIDSFDKIPAFLKPLLSPELGIDSDEFATREASQEKLADLLASKIVTERTDTEAALEFVARSGSPEQKRRVVELLQKLWDKRLKHIPYCGLDEAKDGERPPKHDLLDAETKSETGHSAESCDKAVKELKTKRDAFVEPGKSRGNSYAGKTFVGLPTDEELDKSKGECCRLGPRGPFRTAAYRIRIAYRDKKRAEVLAEAEAYAKAKDAEVIVTTREGAKALGDRDVLGIVGYSGPEGEERAYLYVVKKKR